MKEIYNDRTGWSQYPVKGDSLFVQMLDQYQYGYFVRMSDKGYYQFDFTGETVLKNAGFQSLETADRIYLVKRADVQAFRDFCFGSVTAPARLSRVYRTWSLDDDVTLLTNYKGMNHSQLGLILGRSSTAVRTRYWNIKNNKIQPERTKELLGKIKGSLDG